MSSAVITHIKRSKQGLFDVAGPGKIAQTGAMVLDENFALPDLNNLGLTLPSIETFVVSTTGAVSATGSNDALNGAWLSTVERLARLVQRWATAAEIDLVGDSFITASVTRASEVNGDAHFDDDQFVPAAGAGLVAIVGDRGGPRVAAEAIDHDEIAPPHPVVATDELVSNFANGDLERVDYGPNELVVLPQFAQLHAGPGPCGGADEVRHLLVMRAATSPEDGEAPRRPTRRRSR